MRVEGVIPTQEELQHMVAEVDQVNILLQILNMRSAVALKLDSDMMRTLCSFIRWLSQTVKSKNKKLNITKILAI